MHTMYTTYNNKKEGNSDNESLKRSANFGKAKCQCIPAD